MLGLAEQLVALSPGRLERIDLPEDVRHEIANVRSMRAHGARKRQMAFLAKRMRNHGDDAFAAALAELGEDRAASRREQAAMQRLETLRERLLTEGDAALAELVDACPDIDRQALRSLIRRARSERADNKPPRAYHALFRMLRDNIDTP